MGGRLPCGAVPQLSAWPARGGPKRCCLLCTVPYVVCTYRTLSVYERITSVPSTGFTRIYRYSTIHCMDRDPEIAIPTKAPLALLLLTRLYPARHSVGNELRAAPNRTPRFGARVSDTHTHNLLFPQVQLARAARAWQRPTLCLPACGESSLRAPRRVRGSVMRTQKTSVRRPRAI